jgi:hypothetical protein
VNICGEGFPAGFQPIVVCEFKKELDGLTSARIRIGAYLLAFIRR